MVTTPYSLLEWTDKRARGSSEECAYTIPLCILRYIRIPVAFLLCCCWSVAIEMKRRRRPTLFAHFPSFASFDIPPTLAFFRSFASFLSLQFSIANVNMYPLPLQLLCRLPPNSSSSRLSASIFSLSYAYCRFSADGYYAYAMWRRIYLKFCVGEELAKKKSLGYKESIVYENQLLVLSPLEILSLKRVL